MADTQEAPQLTGDNMPGSIREAQEALLGIMEPEGVKPQEEEAAPTEEEESTEEIQDESFEEGDQEMEASDDQTDDEEVEEPESEEPDLYAVTVDGEEHEVTFDELLKGYSRQSDYTKKTQQLSGERKQMEELHQKYTSEIGQIQQERQQYMDYLNQIVDQSMSGLDKYANVDWEALKNKDPIEYITKREEYRQSQEKLQSMKNEQAQAQHKYAIDMKQTQSEMVQQEHKKLVEAVPEWGDPEQQKTLSSSIKEYGLSQGFSEEELNSLVDHRSVLVLMKAAKLDKMEKSNVKARKLKNKPKVIRPGKGTSQQKQSKSKRTAQMKRLQDTGHVKDASSLFEDFVQM